MNTSQPVVNIHATAVTDTHSSVISISSHSARLTNANLVKSDTESNKPKGKSGGGFFSTLLKLIFFGAVCAAGFVAFKAYQAKKGRPWDPKRF